MTSKQIAVCDNVNVDCVKGSLKEHWTRYIKYELRSNIDRPLKKKRIVRGEYCILREFIRFIYSRIKYEWVNSVLAAHEHLLL